MKAIITLVCVAMLALTTTAQKKKSTAPLATFETFTLEQKDGKLWFLQKEGKVVKLTLELQSTGPKFEALQPKITAFTSGGVKLYVVSWTEKTLQKTTDKTEDIVAVQTRIIDIGLSKVVFSNAQITNNSTEKVFLDRNKTASETQMRVRREGMEIQTMPDGTLLQKNKTQSTKWVYDAKKGEFVTKR